MCKCFIKGLKPEIEDSKKLVQETVANALRTERELHSTIDLRWNQESTPSQILINHEKPVRFVIKKDIQLQTRKLI